MKDIILTAILIASSMGLVIMIRLHYYAFMERQKLLKEHTRLIAYNLRLMKACEFRKMVLETYGSDAFDNTPSVDEIAADDKPITAINYLNTDYLHIKE